MMVMQYHQRQITCSVCYCTQLQESTQQLNIFEILINNNIEEWKKGLNFKIKLRFFLKKLSM